MISARLEENESRELEILRRRKMQPEPNLTIGNELPLASQPLVACQTKASKVLALEAALEDVASRSEKLETSNQQLRNQLQEKSRVDVGSSEAFKSQAMKIAGRLTNLRVQHLEGALAKAATREKIMEEEIESLKGSPTNRQIRDLEAELADAVAREEMWKAANHRLREVLQKSRSNSQAFEAHAKEKVITLEDCLPIAGKSAAPETALQIEQRSQQQATIDNDVTDEIVEANRVKDTDARGWECGLRIEDHVAYLPKIVDGKQVLEQVGENTWLSTNSIHAQSHGLGYRRVKDADALLMQAVQRLMTQDFLTWGESIHGFDEGDGWIRVEFPKAFPIGTSVRAIADLLVNGVVAVKSGTVGRVMTPDDRCLELGRVLVRWNGQADGEAIKMRVCQADIVVEEADKTMGMNRDKFAEDGAKAVKDREVMLTKEFRKGADENQHAEDVTNKALDVIGTWYYSGSSSSVRSYEIKFEDGQYVFIHQSDGTEGVLVLHNDGLKGHVKTGKIRLRLDQSGNMLSQFKPKGSSEWQKVIIAARKAPSLHKEVEPIKEEKTLPLDKDRCCPDGHVLQQFFTSCDGYGCNRCKKTFPPGTALHGCRICDFDVCGDCYQEAHRSRSGTK